MTLVSATPHPVHAAPAATRRWGVWLLIALLAALGAAGGYWGYLKLTNRSQSALAGAKFIPITPIDLQVKVNKDGELQAVDNIDIMCMVEGGSTIVQIVKEGSFVKKGDDLVVLDSSLIRQKIEDTSLQLQTAETDLGTARQLHGIQESQNAANLEAVKIELELARLALKEYTEGTHPKDLNTAKTGVEMARITLANKTDDLRQVRELYAKNFVTLADVKTAELNLTTAGNALRDAESALKVLEEYTHVKSLAQMNSAVAQAEQKLARTQKENAITLNKSKADVDAKDAALVILKRRAERLTEQLEFCTIKAPAEGMVVYAQTSREGGAGPIQEGTVVRERQAMLRLPDTSEMKAVIKVNENQVSRLTPGQQGTVKITGVKDPVGATLTRISPVADSGSRWMNPDLREYPVELTLDQTPAALAVPLAALYAQGNDTFVFVRRPDGGVDPRRVAIAQTTETHVRVREGLAANEQVLLLQPGQGRELLEKSGVQPTGPAEQPKRRGGGNGNGKRREGAPTEATPQPDAAPQDETPRDGGRREAGPRDGAPNDGPRKEGGPPRDGAPAGAPARERPPKVAQQGASEPAR
jgi:HlyD family secretion protein